MFFPDFLRSGSFANELYANRVERTLQGASESYADSKCSRKPGHGFGGSFEETAGGAHYARCFGGSEDSWVETASLVYYSLAVGEGFGGLDHTMGGQGAKRTNDRDIDADTGEAGAGTGNRYGKSPR